MTALIVCLAIYVVSGVLCWLYIHIEHSEKGCSSTVSPEKIEFVITITPLINTITALIWLHDSPYNKEYKSQRLNNFFTWFFNVKSKNPK